MIWSQITHASSLYVQETEKAKEGGTSREREAPD